MWVPLKRIRFDVVLLLLDRIQNDSERKRAGSLLRRTIGEETRSLLTSSSQDSCRRRVERHAFTPSAVCVESPSSLQTYTCDMVMVLTLCFRSILWLLVLVIAAYPIALFSSIWYILLQPFQVCCSTCFFTGTQIFFKLVQLPLVCATRARDSWKKPTESCVTGTEIWSQQQNSYFLHQ